LRFENSFVKLNRDVWFEWDQQGSCWTTLYRPIGRAI
jgi:hypothetical protein